MIKSIDIQNFRCFNRLQVQGFKSINLIGGQNNAGKTALLEALLISCFPSPKSISLIRQFRNENGNNIKNATNKVWNYFFFNQNKDIPIQFISSFDNQASTHIELSCTKNREDILSNIYDSPSNDNKRITDLISSRFADTFLLNIKETNDKNAFNYFLLPDKEDGDIGVVGKMPISFDLSPFLHTLFRLKEDKLAALYSQTKENKKLGALNELLKILDPRIIGSEIDAPGGDPIIKLILQDEQSFPLAMFGDAVRKITEFILILLNTEKGIFLIDEIENGIHFTKHKELWTKLFQIVGNNIQIFATSHSAEMISAFNKVAYQSEFEGKAMYIEMSRTQKTNQIVANTMDMEALNYEIFTNNSYRGE